MLEKIKCDQDDYIACVLLGSNYKDNYGYQKAAQLATKACNDEDFEACYHLEEFYMKTHKE